MDSAVRVGIVGCGAISGQYCAGMRRFGNLRLVGAADLDRNVAEARAREFGIPRVCSVAELLLDEAVDVVLNLTVPRAHAEVSLAALAAGKHVYSEKPLGVTREEGRRVLAAAAERKLRVGCAPDTFLGAGVQTVRKLIDSGAVGRPVAFTAFMMGRGHESWHPSPEFYYEPGGGPMLDMGPYYLTALLNFFGPIRRLSGAASVAIPRRTITSAPKAGKTIDVRVPDHVCGTIEFENGVVGSIVTTFATWHPTYDPDFPITVYGSEGTIKVPDPNLFDGKVQMRLAGDAQWRDVPHNSPTGYGRSIGLADMADALHTGRPIRASGELAFAVLDAMEGFFDSAASGTYFVPTARFERPATLT